MNNNELEVLVGAAGPVQDQVRAASMQKVLAEHISSHLEVKQFEPQQLSSILGARWSPKEIRTQRHK